MVSVPTLKRRIDNRLATAIAPSVDGDVAPHVGVLNARERTQDGSSDDVIQYPYVGYEGFARPDERGLSNSHKVGVTRETSGDTVTTTESWQYVLRLDVGVYASDRVTQDVLTGVVRDELLGYVSDPSGLHPDVSDVNETNVTRDDGVQRNVVGVRDTYAITFTRTRTETETAVTDVTVTLGDIDDRFGETTYGDGPYGGTTFNNETFQN